MLGHHLDISTFSPIDSIMKSKLKHIYQVFGVVGLIIAVAVILRQFAVPPSFGSLGFFRADALEEAKEKSPRHLSEMACQKCHAKQVKLHDKDAHTKVECEVCHGPADKHISFYEESPAQTKRPVPSSAKMEKPTGKESCLTCHQKLAARPSSFPQIEWEEHYRFVGVKDKSAPCTTCHSPHEPLFMDRDIRNARLHPLVHRCRDCHIGSSRDENIPRPKNHPAIFQCKYCHQEIAESFAEKPHAKVLCNTCHLFFKESEFAGRILRDADPRFCLLCHRGGDFRSDDAPPSIEWPSHREDMSQGPQDKDKRCIDCHQKQIHHVNPGGEI